MIVAPIADWAFMARLISVFLGQNLRLFVCMLSIIHMYGEYYSYVSRMNLSFCLFGEFKYYSCVC